jgi:hypothetical protein
MIQGAKGFDVVLSTKITNRRNRVLYPWRRYAQQQRAFFCDRTSKNDEFMTVVHADLNMQPRNEALAITWEQHRRTRELCDRFSLPLHELSFNGSRWRRYLNLGFETVRLLRTHRPKLVYVQNPSLVLALLVILTRGFAGTYRILMDAHNEAVTPFTHAFWPIPVLSRFAIRRADVTIVTNAALARIVEKLGGTPFVLPDRLPTPPIQPRPEVPLGDVFQVMVVATYAADEPIAEIIEAGRRLGSPFQLLITGRETKLPAEQRAMLPPNVKQTGFLSEHAYWELMRDSHVVVDFTLKDNCLVCGAYESLAMKRPMILSGNPATVDLFGEVATFPDSHAPSDIANALKDTQERYRFLAAKTVNGVEAFSVRWQNLATALETLIEDWKTA